MFRVVKVQGLVLGAVKDAGSRVQVQGLIISGLHGLKDFWA